jgi:hypothetical protein
MAAQEEFSLSQEDFAAKAATKSARRAALQLKLRKTQQQLSQLATQ